MPFKKGDLNNLSFRQKRKKNRMVTQKSSEKPFSPRLQTIVLERIASGVESSSVLAETNTPPKDGRTWLRIAEMLLH